MHAVQRAKALMSGLDFSAFFHAIHGIPPLPWQARLATVLDEQHGWPDLIDLPTASGKTACIDIAIFHLARSAVRGEPWLAARRIAFVVDRRIIVDAAFERAGRIKKALEESKEPAIVAVAEALRRLGGEKPLDCQKLRGGMPRERGFALHPAQPMVITSTIDQIGSRLLFRGYGLSPYAQPVHAGLLGHDTLILLDEAHLAVPFKQTVAAIRREQSRAMRQLAPVRPVTLVSLSATPGPYTERFQLGADDLAHPLIAQRRAAPKPARLVEITGSEADRLKVLLRETLATYNETDGPAPAIAVIVNRVRTARELFAKLNADPRRDFDLKLVTGRSRPLDRDRLAKWLMARAQSGRKPYPDDKGLIVVATQALEVGADLDFHGLVTECASLDALRQRFGRLDRLGNFKKARATIMFSNDTPDDDPIYGRALRRTWQWLQNVGQNLNGSITVDFSIASIERLLQSADVAAMLAEPRDMLQLTPSHVELLCQTSPRPSQDPDIGALLHGFQSGEAEVQIVWRADIPASRHRQQWMLDSDKAELANSLLTIIPPNSLEAISLPLQTLRGWLGGGSAMADLSDMEGTRSDKEDGKTDKNAVVREVLHQTSKGWKVASAHELRPGDIVVVPAVYGGCDEFGFSPGSDSEVTDLYEEARKELLRESIVILTPAKLRKYVADERADDVVKSAWATLSNSYDAGQSDANALLQELIAALGPTSAATLGLAAYCFSELLLSSKNELSALILRTDQIGSDDLSDENLSSSYTVPVLLDAHNVGVGKRAHALAGNVGLDDHFQKSLGRSGDTHDLGKADPRFQRLLRAGNHTALPGQLLAKGLRRVRPVRPQPAERHEAYSVALLKRYPSLLKDAPDPDLALYLAGVHHGRGRPLMPNRPDEGTRFDFAYCDQQLQFDGAPHLGDLGSGWASLFWRQNEHYGSWGVAYLEALLRLADQLQSSDEVKQARNNG
jgi:CRISPR-associated endonuclease/helicase Cas3